MTPMGGEGVISELTGGRVLATKRKPLAHLLRERIWLHGAEPAVPVLDHWALCPATCGSVELVLQQQRQTGSIEVPRLLFDASGVTAAC